MKGGFQVSYDVVLFRVCTNSINVVGTFQIIFVSLRILQMSILILALSIRTRTLDVWTPDLTCAKIAKVIRSIILVQVSNTIPVSRLHLGAGSFFSSPGCVDWWIQFVVITLVEFTSSQFLLVGP